MGVVPLISLAFPLQLHLQTHLSTKTHFKNPTLCPNYSLGVNNCGSSRSKTAKLRSKSNDQEWDPPSPLYMDENGVVNDMEGYLNSLSLEYDSVWDTKPSWFVFSFLPLSFLFIRMSSSSCFGGVLSDTFFLIIGCFYLILDCKYSI